MAEQKLLVKREGDFHYPIYFENDFSALAQAVREEGFSGCKICIVTDSHVAPLYYEAVENTLVLTNQSKLYGAGTIFYKDVLRETAEILRADRLVILPSSIHEVLVLKQNTDSESKFYREMVQNVNYEAVRRDEVLDDTYYLYDKKTDRIKVC